MEQKKLPDYSGYIFMTVALSWNIWSEREMLIRSQTKTLPQISYEFMLASSYFYKYHNWHMYLTTLALTKNMCELCETESNSSIASLYWW